MNHPSTEDLDPALSLAGGTAFAATFVALDVHLAAGLGEGEVMGTEPGLSLRTVDFPDNGVQGTL